MHYHAPFLDPEDQEPMYRSPKKIPLDGQRADVAEITGSIEIGWDRVMYRS